MVLCKWLLYKSTNLKDFKNKLRQRIRTELKLPPV
jgi:hypothetical protein